MKKAKKITVSLLTVAVLGLNTFLSPGLRTEINNIKAASYTPIFSVSDRANGQSSADISENGGRIPLHTAISSYESDSYHSGTELKGNSSYPSYYSSADLGYTSGVDNQMTTDACWAFTHNELIEINLAKKFGVKFDFSE